MRKLLLAAIAALSLAGSIGVASAAPAPSAVQPPANTFGGGG
jgi:hypothetical protein